MNASRFHTLTRGYAGLRIAVIGDFCLDRYLEIDPAKAEISLETNLPVHNVVNIRSQPGGAGTILNNLVALGLREIWAVGASGEDGEGFELRRALAALPGVRTDHFFTSPDRHTFTYTKPLVIEPGQPPRELNRLDLKNWSPLSPALEKLLQTALVTLAPQVDAFILLEQVDLANTGVLSFPILETIKQLTAQFPRLRILADSRRGLAHFPPVSFKMNREELARLLALSQSLDLQEIQTQASILANRLGNPVFVTAAQNGIIGAFPGQAPAHVPALPLRGPIDIVGAGDAVTANLATALAAGASLSESLELASAAASIVIHQLGTTGTANINQIAELLSIQPGWFGQV
jgi:rfaE bifunctional protein kinase chain/domain